jgi:cell division protein FtsL
MSKISPIYKRLLVMAIVFYILASCYMMSELYYKVMDVEHKVMHLTGEH